jgi:hypothetical protein
MKAKRFLLMAVGLLCACQLFSYPSTLKERNETWLQATTASGNPGPGEGRTGGEIATQEDPGVPVGDALWLMVLLSGGYAIAKRRTICKILNLTSH